MIEKLTDLPGGIDGFAASGTVTRADYAETLVPLFEAARRQGRQLRILVECGPTFQRFTPDGTWADAKIGLSSLRLVLGWALLTDITWLRESVRVLGFVTPGQVRAFGNAERRQAVAWLESLPEGAAVSIHLVPGSDVLVVQIKESLRAQDFDALALKADAVIEARGGLQGLVIHAPAFPGWENLEGFVRHLQFVRNYQGNVKRIALAVDGRLADLAPLISKHLLKAEVKGFGYDALDQAVAWARGSAARVTHSEGEAPPAVHHLDGTPAPAPAPTVRRRE